MSPQTEPAGGPDPAPDDATPTDDEPAASFAEPGPVVAIDGPAGSGKSTVAARVAERLDVVHLDTGAFYRAVTLACLDAGVDLDDEEACGDIAGDVDIFRYQGRTFLDGEDVEDEIRGPEVTAAVSTVSSHGAVREALAPLQRAALRDGGVAEGRDIGTVVAPDADLKVFLTASVEERARRRAAQLGVEDRDGLRAEIDRRDQADSSRAHSPLATALDAWTLDTTELTVDDIVEAIAARATEAYEHRLAIAADPVRARRALPRVAVVGRPNVGKSTLVNRILGHRVTIVEERPGVTRDRTEHVARWGDQTFVIVDTGGWEHAAEGMTAEIVRQAEAAIDSADLALFVVDVTVGALEDDERYAKLLRRAGKPVLLVANKADSAKHEADAYDLYSLGLGDPVPISAAHGRGVGDLLDDVLGMLPARGPDELPDETDVPHVAIVGKPNVGKSSLFNRLLGEERSIVDSVPHTTRDAVDTIVEIDGEPWVFVDTAGLRRRYRTGEDTELFSVDRTRRAIETSDLVLFVLDASEPISEQDQRLAALIRDAGRGAVLVLNKWDLVDDQRREDLDRELDRMLRFASWVPRVNVSAASGRSLHRLVPQLREVWEAYRGRISTRALNLWLEQASDRVPPPLQGDRILRLKYITQAESRPPRFVLFANAKVPQAYRRYLERGLRETYGFPGVPIVVEDRPPRDRQRRRTRR